MFGRVLATNRMNFIGPAVLTCVSAGLYYGGYRLGQHNVNAAAAAAAAARPQWKPPLTSSIPSPSTFTKEEPPKPADGKDVVSTWSSTGDIIFSFGPQGKYYFVYRSPGTTSFGYTGSVSEYSLVATTSDVDRRYFHAWTSTADELLGYKSSLTDKVLWSFQMSPSRPSTASTYRSLLLWLSENVKTEEEMLATKVIFGSGTSYFAQCGPKVTYHDLPAKLTRVLDEKRHAVSDPASTPHAWIPRILALGADNDFIAIWPDGRKVTSLSVTTGLSALIKQITDDYPDTVVPDHKWTNIALSNTDKNSFFAVQNDGTILWYRLGTNESNLEILVAADTYMQMRAKRDGQTFRFMQGLSDGKLVSLEIGPETNVDREMLEGIFRSRTKQVEGRVVEILGRVRELVGWK